MKFYRMYFFAVLIIMGISSAAFSCDIVYGDNWAFSNKAPENWIGGCNELAMEGTAVSYWPSKQSQQNSDSYIYVTVSTKSNLNDISEFISQEQSRFKADLPNVKFSKIEDSKNSNADIKHFYKVSYNNSSGRSEFIVYRESETAYFIIIMTANTESILLKHKSEFIAFNKSFVPMKKT